MALSEVLVDQAAPSAPANSDLSGDECLLSALLEHTTDSIYFKNVESRFVKINRVHAQLLGLADPRDGIGKTDREFFGAECARESLREEQQIIQSGVPLIDKEKRQEWPDGSTTWTSTSKRPLFDRVGRCIGTLGISRDITKSKEAENTLSNAHRDAELFINSVPSILIFVDIDGRIKRWNRAAAEAFGISRASAIGKPLASCGIKWLSQDLTSEITSLPEQPELARCRLKFVKNGQERLLGLTLRWIRTTPSESAELLIVAADITDREHADEDLLWKTAFLEAQTNSTGDGILIVDTQGNKLLQNHHIQELFKIPQSITDKSDCKSLLEHVLTTVKDPDRLREKVEYLNDHRNHTSRDELELLNGTVLEQYSSPVLGRFNKYYGRIWTFRDITERKQTEASLRQLSMAVEQSPVSVEITDLHGKITYVNTTFSESSGYAANEVLGKSASILKSGHSSPADYRQLWETITVGGEWRGLFHNRKKNGELYWESAVIRPIEDHDGSISHFLALKEDITEKLAMEGQLRQSQKLEAIGQLAAGIAHEINTPIQYIGDNTRFIKESWGHLASLLAAAQKLRAELTAHTVSQAVIDTFDNCSRVTDVAFLSEDIPRAIDQTLEGVERVARIVSAMKEFSHPGAQEKQAVDLNRAIETTVAISRNEWKYVADVQTTLDPNLPLVPCLAGEINQVLLNLVINAAHAIADASDRRTGGLGTIVLSTKRDGDWVEISVADTGTGIPEHLRDRVFEPFFTTKEVGKGTGQGLTLAYAVIVKRHGGSIWLDSEVGKGTTFFVRLPIMVSKEH
ncbi:MAG: PAS domain S-box protein [Acidobacteriaceae bacterium]|jgi:PAS domain S-box-containing protein